jgi:hypothetical protein
MDLKYFDLGEIYMMHDFSNKKTVIQLITAATSFALKNDFIPVALRISQNDTFMNKDIMNDAGYDCTSRFINISHNI